MRYKLIAALQSIVDIPDMKFEVYVNRDKQHGEYGSNIAMTWAQYLQVSAMDCAHAIVSKIVLPAGILRVEVAAPGFLNFYISEQYPALVVLEILKLKALYGIGCLFEINSIRQPHTPKEARFFAYQDISARLGVVLALDCNKVGNTQVQGLTDDSALQDALAFFYFKTPFEQPLTLDAQWICSESLDNPWYSVKYAYERTTKILQMLVLRNIKQTSEIVTVKWRPTALQLIEKLSLFPDLVEDLRGCISLNHLYNYLKNLATNIHYYYNEITILDNDHVYCSANMMLLLACQWVLRNSLGLMGVKFA